MLLPSQLFVCGWSIMGGILWGVYYRGFTIGGMMGGIFARMLQELLGLRCVGNGPGLGIVLWGCCRRIVALLGDDPGPSHAL